MGRGRHNFLSFWTVFTLLSSYWPRKSKFCKNEKYTWRYYHFTNVYHKWQSCDVWFLRYGMQRVDFFCHFGAFLPFYSPNNLKNQSFQKMKKSLGDIIILHMSTINDSHLMYGSWDIEHDGQNFLTFWTIFSTFSPLATRKTKILKNWKKHLEISPFDTSVPKIMIIYYTVPEIGRMTDVIVIFYFGLFFAFLPP